MRLVRYREDARVLPLPSLEHSGADPRTLLIVPCCLDENVAQMAVAGLGDAAATDSARPAQVCSLGTIPA